MKSFQISLFKLKRSTKLVFVKKADVQ